METSRVLIAFRSAVVAVLVVMAPTWGYEPAIAADSSTREWLTPKIEAPRVSYHSFYSPAARARVSYHLYTPAAYSNDDGRRYPVVYWLHGSGGGLRGIRPLTQLVEEAIQGGQVPPFLLVFVNGLRLGMYVNWKDGSAPLETVIARDLVDHIDKSYRTISSREGRILDGFSMGGYGAARFGFKFPEMFGAVSIVGAGPMQETLTRAPRVSEKTVEKVMRDVYGNDPTYFTAVSPRALAVENAGFIKQRSKIRIVIGDRDNTFVNNQEFHEHLVRLDIPHDWIVVEGIGHDPMAVLRALGDRHWTFYREAMEHTK